MNQQNANKISNDSQVINNFSRPLYCCWCLYVRWILSILIWGSIIVLIISSKLFYYFYIFWDYFILFILCEILSPTFFLFKYKSNKKLDEIMSNFFNNHPKIVFKYIEYYGNGYMETTSPFAYNNCSNISEKWIINKEESKGKSFIKLNVVSEVYFGNQSTFNIYTMRRNNFIKKVKSNNIMTDIYFEGLENYYFICSENNNFSCFSNCGCYILFVILSLGEIYTLILNKMTLEKTVFVKKKITSEIVLYIGDFNNNQIQNATQTEQNVQIADRVIIHVNQDKNVSNKKDKNVNNNYLENDPIKNTERNDILKISQSNNPN